ncbi:MAG TPA: hypothetical protein VKM55_29555 [Candidatus Lokiarchaeia archaeon]|nr:hypothetical protein [Candidatus Lokiarchaeia archaeon]
MVDPVTRADAEILDDAPGNVVPRHYTCLCIVTSSPRNKPTRWRESIISL